MQTHFNYKKMPFNEIRGYYEAITPAIIARSVKGMWHTPYCNGIDFTSLMTPIEMDTWIVIRCFGRFPLYPQYPVGKYFVDFGNPYFKVAVECDGKQFHQDKEKDLNRDIDLKKLGWNVYRVTGSQCVQRIDLYVEDLEGWDKVEKLKSLMPAYYDSVDGLIKALAIKHCNYPIHNDYELPYAMDCLDRLVSKATVTK